MNTIALFGDWISIIEESSITFVFNKIQSLINKNNYELLHTFSLCSRTKCKVIIISDNKNWVTDNLYCCVNEDAIPKQPKSFNIAEIEKQGVLILPLLLSTDINKNYPWKSFIAKIIRKLCEIETGLIFVLVGQESKKFETIIPKYNQIFSYGINTVNSQIFKDINRKLTILYGQPIQWYISY